MENSKKNIFRGVLVAGAIITGSAFSVNATNALSFNELGSGSEIRAKLLNNADFALNIFEAKCGEATKTTEAKKATTTKKTTEAKSKEMKCGEGKCGEAAKAKNDSTSKAKAVKAVAPKKKTEDKSKEAKCGEGKCGESN